MKIIMTFFMVLSTPVFSSTLKVAPVDQNLAIVSDAELIYKAVIGEEIVILENKDSSDQRSYLETKYKTNGVQRYTNLSVLRDEVNEVAQEICKSAGLGSLVSVSKSSNSMYGLDDNRYTSFVNTSLEIVRILGRDFKANYSAGHSLSLIKRIECNKTEHIAESNRAKLKI